MITKGKILFLSVVLSAVLPAFNAQKDVQEPQLGKRTEYPIPLVKMSLRTQKGQSSLKSVRVSINGFKEYAHICTYDDFYFKDARLGVEKTVHQESPDRAFMISDFEAKQLSRVTASLISTLETFEKDLKNKRWDRCLYLDAYLPRFLNTYYHLTCAARNSTHAFPRIARIPGTEFDVSLKSRKSDARIKGWQDENDYIIKLRLISSELVYQLIKWRQKELNNSKRNKQVSYSAKAEEAYGLFVKIYFNLRPIPELPHKGKHL